MTGTSDSTSGKNLRHINLLADFYTVTLRLGKYKDQTNTDVVLLS